MSVSAVVMWCVLIALFLVIELMTVGMVSIWFMIGAIVALIAAVLKAPMWLQIVLFLLVSGVCFALLYPKLKKSVRKKNRATNLDMVIGETCVVVRRIDNVAGTGAVSVGGKTWTARTDNDEIVEEGALVRAERISGVKLIVSPLHETLVN